VTGQSQASVLKIPSTVDATSDGARNLYLDLMKRCLADTIYQHVNPRSARHKHLGERVLFKLVRMAGYEVTDREPPSFDPASRSVGRDWPSKGHTMVGLARLDNVQRCVEDVIAKGIPGDLIETGVWRGGVAIFLRAILKAHDVTNRVVWAADSFEGLPRPDVEKFPEDEGDPHYLHTQLAVSLEEVKSNFERYGLLDEQVKFLKGFFRDTLPKSPVGKLAVLRLDGDMYESTIEALEFLYPKLSPGGYVIIDDYSYPPCKNAVTDYRLRHGIAEPISEIDWSGVYWQRRA
jgi:Macrocin-O-methyltransferase (TylF)